MDLANTGNSRVFRNLAADQLDRQWRLPHGEIKSIEMSSRRFGFAPCYVDDFGRQRWPPRILHGDFFVGVTTRLGRMAPPREARMK
jgi:hypothetical protein